MIEEQHEDPKQQKGKNKERKLRPIKISRANYYYSESTAIKKCVNYSKSTRVFHLLHSEVFLYLKPFKYRIK